MDEARSGEHHELRPESDPRYWNRPLDQLESSSDAVERARIHYERGLTLFNEENYDAALFEFERSYEGAPKRATPPPTARSVSRTNTQVADVDEADIVKTDGRYVYLVMNGTLRIVEALSPRVVSTTKLEGKTRELFIEGDRAVIYTAHSKTGGSSGVSDSGHRCTYGYECDVTADGTSTKVLVLDIADRSKPKLVREIGLSGSLIASRRIGSAVHTVVADGENPFIRYPIHTRGAYRYQCGATDTTIAEVSAEVDQLKVDNEQKIRAALRGPTIRENGAVRDLCTSSLRTALRDGHAYTTVASFDLADSSAKPATTVTIESRPGAVFASSNALYLSVVHNRDRYGWYDGYSALDEVSEIHKLRIGTNPRDTQYIGSGIAPGHVLSQHSMDQWSGYLRVATTRGRVPDPRVESIVSIFAESENGSLVRVGAVDHIAPGEDIRAVRFDGDRGYVVTFKKTDPLFVVDLYDPSRPAILGELKIPGFSTYLHRIDPGHLLSIGFDADDRGSYALYDGLLLQLFDARNPTEPRLLHREKIGSRGTSSEAATDHLAFNYLAERGLLAIPTTICSNGGESGFGGHLTFSGLLVYDVNVERGFTRLGAVDHGTPGANCQTWWSRAESQVKRSLFVDDLVYSIATDRMKVQRMKPFGTDVFDLPLVPAHPLPPLTP